MRVSNLVRKVLGTSREARNSDKVLILKVWEECGFYLNPAQRDKFWSLPKAETIRRDRQKFQEKGMYLADQKIARERRYMGYRMQQMNPQVDKVENILEQQAIPWNKD
jgi:hypothetical protein